MNYVTFLLGGLSLSGLIFSGLIAKELVYATTSSCPFVSILYCLVAFFTAFYIMRIALVVIQDKKLVNTVNFKKFIPIGFLFLLNIVFYFFVRGKVEYKIAEPFYLAFLGWAVVYILYVKNLLTKFTTTPKILENFYNKILVKIYEKIAQVSDFIELNFLSNYKPVMLFAKCSVKISDWIEENIMNKSVKITVNSAKKLSEWGAKLQSRNVQTYNAYGFILLTIVITLIIIGYTMMFNQLS